jgi:hypothetical protein
METISPVQLWAGRGLSAFVVLFLIFDSGVKLAKSEMAVKPTLELGYPESAIFTIGLLLAIGIVLYVIPQTAVFGAIYITAYLGGAVASQFRVGNPLFSHTLFPTYVAAMLWGGLVLRNPRLWSVLIGGQ